MSTRVPTTESGKFPGQDHVILRRPPEWAVAFTLTSTGAKKFDPAAERLFNDKPQGRIAIVLDNVLDSAPVIQSAKFGGQ